MKRAAGELIVIDGLPNLRDIGGWPVSDGSHVRRGALYRSVELNRLSDVGVAASLRSACTPCSTCARRWSGRRSRTDFPRAPLTWWSTCSPTPRRTGGTATRRKLPRHSRIRQRTGRIPTSVHRARRPRGTAGAHPLHDGQGPDRLGGSGPSRSPHARTGTGKPLRRRNGPSPTRMSRMHCSAPSAPRRGCTGAAR